MMHLKPSHEVPRGTVSSLKHRRAAVQAARSVRGVDEVYDLLKVRLVPGDLRDDKLRVARRRPLQ